MAVLLDTINKRQQPLKDTHIGFLLKQKLIFPCEEGCQTEEPVYHIETGVKWVSVLATIKKIDSSPKRTRKRKAKTG